MLGDLTLFNRRDGVELSWRILEPIIDSWQAVGASASLPTYAAGTWGPALADALLARDGRSWKNAVSLARFDLTGTTASGEPGSDG